MSSFIEIKNLHFSYVNDLEEPPVKTEVLKGINLNIEKGEFVAVLGHNGSGKSTLAKCINAINLPESGAVYVNGMDTLDENNLLPIREKVGMVFQNPDNQIVATIVEEDVAFALENMGVEPNEIRRRVDEALKTVGMYEYRLHAPHKLSGGQIQRVAIAGIIALKPDCILLDEPTNHLDMESISWLENYLLNYSGAVLIVAHDRYFLDKIVSKIIELDNGNATVFSGNYTDYASKKAILRNMQLKEYLNQQREIKHQEEVITKLKQFNREKSIKRAESREKMLNKMEFVDKPEILNDKMDIKLEPNVISGNDVLTVDNLTKGFDGTVLFDNICFQIKRGERVALIGSNGTGKTTILK